MAFYPLEQLSRMSDGYQKAFKVADKQLLLCQVEGDVYVIENRCPHMDLTFTYGTLLPGKQIRCPAHGIAFSLDSGKADGPLAEALECLQKFSVVY
ncbi:MAG: rieske, partial [Alteromonadaceae bacterium]